MTPEPLPDEPGYCRRGVHPDPVRLDTNTCRDCRLEWRRAYKRRPAIAAHIREYRRARRLAGLE